VGKNSKTNLITIVENSSSFTKGDDALIALFRKEKYDAVASDDAKLIRLLKINSIPVVLPGLIIYHLLRDGIIGGKTALRALEQLYCERLNSELFFGYHHKGGHPAILVFLPQRR